MEKNSLLNLEGTNAKTEWFFWKWEDNENDDEVRIKLINEFINTPDLRLSLFKRKQEFLICLNQWIDSDNPELYEKGIIIISDLIDIHVINDSELRSINPLKRAILCLEQRKLDEESHYTIIRQVSALNVLSYLDRLEIPWNDECTRKLRELNGLQSIISFLEQDHQQGYKAQATQVLGMIIEDGGMNEELEKLGVGRLLRKLSKHRNKVVKQNAIDALDLLYEDVEEGEEDEEQQD
jgi:hypothetical protein